jgi:hypothetical protein
LAIGILEGSRPPGVRRARGALPDQSATDAQAAERTLADDQPSAPADPRLRRACVSGWSSICGASPKSDTAAWPRTWRARRPCLPWPISTSCIVNCSRQERGAGCDPAQDSRQPPGPPERPTTTRGLAFSPDRRHSHVKRWLLNDLCRGSLTVYVSASRRLF